MTRAPVQLNRFFVSNDFSVSYRRAKQLHWQSQATAGYALLAMIGGEAEYDIDRRSLVLHTPEFALFEPNESVTISAKQA